jgi:response regulator RpfG family c-di-GMP phosphodiesterase
LKGEQIPLAARIFSVAEAWSDLRMNRLGRAGQSFEAASQHLRERSGIWFDPKVVETLFTILDAESD